MSKRKQMKKHIYDELSHFSEGLAAVCRKGKWGYIDTTGREVIECRFDDCRAFYNGVAQVCEREGSWNEQYTEIADACWGMIDKTGKYLISPIYNSISYSSEESVLGETREGTWIFIGLDGQPLFTQEFTDALPFEDGIAVVEQNGRWGAIDRQGNTIIPFLYDFLTLFFDGYAVAEKNGERFYINQSGERVIF